MKIYCFRELQDNGSFVFSRLFAVVTERFLLFWDIVFANVTQKRKNIY